jgi:diadenosine tetraphosphate (Ap4A) HIT family hydrolase
MKECPFCYLAHATILENKFCLAIEDGFPVSPGHLLIIPREHFPTWFDAPKEVQHSMLELVDLAKQLIDEQRQPDGYNLGINCGTAAGQSVDHLHLHLIPRYAGDMPNPKGGVRGVIPEKQKY